MRKHKQTFIALLQVLQANLSKVKSKVGMNRQINRKGRKNMGMLLAMIYKICCELDELYLHSANKLSFVISIHTLTCLIVGGGGGV